VLRWLYHAVIDPKVGDRLVKDEGEQVVDEVRHHWIVYVRSAAELLLAGGLLVIVWFSSLDIAWLPLLLALGVAVHALWLALDQHVDRFVITNMRVFRIQGLAARRQATMPITRILDITVEKPLLGRLLGWRNPKRAFGHFVFESAAQDQGLRDIRYVGDPDGRDLKIQHLIQRAGLRSRATTGDSNTAE
jgi:hypothetical protein